jgi:hypothetical protein
VVESYSSSINGYACSIIMSNGLLPVVLLSIPPQMVIDDRTSSLCTENLA